MQVRRRSGVIAGTGGVGSGRRRLCVIQDGALLSMSTSTTVTSEWGVRDLQRIRILSATRESPNDSVSSDMLMRQTGQVVCFSNQAPTHRVWKMWPQNGSCRSTSHSSYSTRHIGHLSARIEVLGQKDPQHIFLSS